MKITNEVYKKLIALRRAGKRPIEICKLLDLGDASVREKIRLAKRHGVKFPRIKFDRHKEFFAKLKQEHEDWFKSQKLNAEE